VRLLVSAAFDTRANVGISLYIRRIVPELARLCELTVLTPDPELFLNDARVIRIPEYTRSHLGRVFWTAAILGRYCTRHFDAVLCPTPVAPVIARIPVVGVVHDLTPLMLPHAHPTELKALFWLALQTLRQAGMLITVSEHTKRDLTSRFHLLPTERIRVVLEGPGILPDSHDSVFSEHLRPYVLYVGGHARHKNVPRLIAAFARLSSASSLKLVIAGWSKPELIARTERAIQRHNLKQKVVIIRDHLREAELSSLYAGCTAFVYPSFYEGFGLPVLEAMAHGAPVACSGVTSLPEVGGDAAVYFDPTSVTDITEKLQAIMNDAELTRRLRHDGPLRAAEFSWAKTASDMLQVVLESASRAHSRGCLP
jgi:glycosyltransferase involved in cell wall biosynthesis